MKTKLSTAFLILLISYVSVNAQDINNAPEKKSYSNSIGIGAGFCTGFGLSYRYIPKKIGVQLNFAPYFTDYGKNSTVSAGITFLDKIVEGNATNLYLYLANHYFMTRESLVSYSGTEYNSADDIWNTGFGLGFEFNTKKRVVLNLMVGYAQYDSFRSLFFTAETALYYRF